MLDLKVTRIGECILTGGTKKSIFHSHTVNKHVKKKGKDIPVAGYGAP
jgi:hypothetical protein